MSRKVPVVLGQHPLLYAEKQDKDVPVDVIA